jgi:hypothetical protein
MNKRYTWLYRYSECLKFPTPVFADSDFWGIPDPEFLPADLVPDPALIIERYPVLVYESQFLTIFMKSRSC